MPSWWLKSAASENHTLVENRRSSCEIWVAMWLCPCPSSNHAGMVAPDARQLVRNAQEVSQQQGVSHHCSSSGATSIQNWKHWNPFLSEWPLIKSNSPATLSFPDMRPESCCIPDKSWKRSCSSITSDVLMHFPSGPPTLAPRGRPLSTVRLP